MWQPMPAGSCGMGTIQANDCLPIELAVTPDPDLTCVSLYYQNGYARKATDPHSDIDSCATVENYFLQHSRRYLT